MLYAMNCGQGLKVIFILTTQLCLWKFKQETIISEFLRKIILICGSKMIYVGWSFLVTFLGDFWTHNTVNGLRRTFLKLYSVIRKCFFSRKLLKAK